MTKVNATNFRKDMFNYLNKIFVNNEGMIIEKGGIPIAKVIPFYLNRDTGGKTLEEILDKTRGSWADDKEFDRLQKKRRKIELAATKRNRSY